MRVRVLGIVAFGEALADALAVDFGGGTFDVAVIRFAPDGGDVIGLAGIVSSSERRIQARKQPWKLHSRRTRAFHAFRARCCSIPAGRALAWAEMPTFKT